jgi:hypothetical protein
MQLDLEPSEKVIWQGRMPIIVPLGSLFIGTVALFLFIFFISIWLKIYFLSKYSIDWTVVYRDCLFKEKCILATKTISFSILERARLLVSLIATPLLILVFYRSLKTFLLSSNPKRRPYYVITDKRAIYARETSSGITIKDIEKGKIRFLSFSSFLGLMRTSIKGVGKFSSSHETDNSAPLELCFHTLGSEENNLRTALEGFEMTVS